MRRLLLLGLVAASLSSCGGSNDTLVVVHFEKGNLTEPIDRIEVTLDLAGQPASQTLSEGGAAIALPTSAVFRIRNGEGTLRVRGEAFAGARSLSVGSKSGAVVRGDTLTLVVTFGMEEQLPDGGTDATPGDGGPDLDAGNARLVLDKTTQDFGTVVTGTTSAPASFTVTNSGTVASGALTVALGGADAGLFALASNGCAGMTLAPAASCQLTVTLTPTTQGTPSATLTVSATPGGSVQATLSGMAVTPGALMLSTMNHDFGSVVLGQTSAPTTLTVTNSGGSATGTLMTNLAGTDAGQFAITADGCNGQTLGAAQACTITVRMGPSSAGAKSATLSVAGSPGGTAVAALTGMGLEQGALSIAPATRDFGSFLTGTSSTVQSFTVTNTGGSATGMLASALGGTHAGEFAIVSDGCNQVALAAAATCAVTVRFNPASAGAKSASLTVSGSPGGAAVAALSGVGLGPAALSLTPTTQDYGQLVINNASSATFTVRNTGGVMSTTPSPTLSGAAAAEFSITSNNCSAGLPPSGTCTVIVRYLPTSMGSKSALLTVTATTGGTATATLTGSAVTAGALLISPASKDFGGVLLGASSANEVFTVTNTGGSASGMLTTTIGGGSATEFEKISDTCHGQTLAAAAACTVVVRLTPSARGSRTASITVAGTPGGTAQSSLSGTGLALASLSITPTTQDFGILTTGTTTTRSFTVRNEGDQTTGALAVAVTGADFTVVAPSSCAGVTLAGGVPCTLTIQFAPTTSGAKTGSLSVTGSPGGSAPATLTGTGQTPPNVVAGTSSLDFATVVIGQSSTVRSYTLTNTGQATSAVLGLTASGSTEFVRQTGAGGDCVPGTTTLAGGAACTVRFVFTPTMAGARSGTSAWSAGAQNGSVALSGTGQTASGVTASPASLAFGAVTLGNSSAVMSYVLTNNGGATAPVLTLSNTGGDFVQQTGQAGDCVSGTTALAGGASCNVRFVFTPSAAGARSGSSAWSAGQSGTVTLSGTGQTAASVVASPTTLSFGAVTVGSSSAVVSYTLTNSGQATSPVVSLTPGGSAEFVRQTGGGSDCVPGTTTLAGGLSCTVRFVFSPTSSGAKSATSAWSAGQTGTVNLSGTGQTPASVAASPASLSFGTLTIGQSSAIVSYTLTNSGEATAPVLTFTQTGAADFARQTGLGTDCVSGTTTLAGGGSCTMRFVFTPTASGARSATSSWSAGQSGNVGLSGTGQTAANVVASTTSLSFGSVVVGSSSAVFSYTLTNNGQATSPVVTLTQTGSTNFVRQTGLGTDCVSGTTTLAGAASCTVRFIFSPSATGSITGTSSWSAGQSADVGLSGTGAPVGSQVLTVTLTGLASVTSAPAGISCPGTCSASFTTGTSVVLTTVSVSPSRQSIAAITGCDTRVANKCTVAMSAARGVGVQMVAGPSVFRGGSGGDEEGGGPMAGGRVSTIIYSGGYDYLRRLNADGSDAWLKKPVSVTGVTGTISVDAMVVDASDNAVLVGDRGANGGMAVAKVSSTGATVWAKTWGGASINDYPLAVAVNAAGEVAAAGRQYVGTSYDMVVAKWDSAGTLVFQTTYAGAAGVYDHGYAVAIDSAGNVILGGEEGLASGRQTFLRKYGPTGAILWTHSPAIVGAGIYHVAVDSADNILAAHAGTAIAIRKLTPAGVASPFLTLTQYVNALKVDAGDNVLVATQDIKRYSSDGTMVLSSAIYPNTFAGLGTDTYGNILVSTYDDLDFVYNESYRIGP